MKQPDAERGEKIPPAFMVDHMLLRLGKFLRLLGYDTAWNTSIRSHELVTVAQRQGRIFLTRNHHIHRQFPAPERFILITTDNPIDQLTFVLENISAPQPQPFSRCVICNTPLRKVADPSLVRTRVPPAVAARIRRFTYCPKCDKIYWMGSHVINTCRKLGIDPVIVR